MRNSKPDWLRVDLPTGKDYLRLKNLLSANGLHTVCQEANCPNIGDCFSRGTATFMMLGDTCTRNCRYCNVAHGEPETLDLDEPMRVARAVRDLHLDYVVITSVTRDDLPDGGAGVFARTIEEIKKSKPDCKIEVLIPDFKGDEESLRKVIDARPHIINHNLETVRRLYPTMRAQGDYERSLGVLRNVCSVTAKSGLMLGLGETGEEVVDSLNDLHEAGVRIVTLGQYLQPSLDHASVKKYYHPKEFEKFKEIAYDIGFDHVESGPLVRSSYHAREYGL
ncbi:MAG: lipoyl synthase [Candidatus Altiarchaeota archaeon]|nr:lipoyl synthase [Candidatus Altiarchaeota archaeon]